MLSSYAFYYNGTRLVPAPTFSVEKKFTYLNDALSGYTYVMNIQGYASAIDPLTNPGSSLSNVDKTIRSIDKVNSTFHKNGGTLLITYNDIPVIEAIGGQLRSFEVSDTENRWLNYAQYSCSIEFSDMLLYDNLGTLNYEINADSTTGQSTIAANDISANLIRIKDYKDSWSFNTSDEEAHAYYSIANSGSGVSGSGLVTLAEDYTSINVEYKIDATGKHFFEPDGTLIPAWDRAKQFVQEKMYYQIAMFRRDVGAVTLDANNKVINNSNRAGFPLADSNRDSSVVSLTGQSAYDSTSAPLIPEDLLVNSHTHTFTTQGPPNPPLFGFFITANYDIFNEKIICETSESEGTFSATYSCILKRSTLPNNFMRNATHKYDLSVEETNDFTTSVRNININGTVQGLLPTNILSAGLQLNEGSPFHLQLPSTGPFIVSSRDPTSKYYYAWYHFVKDIVKDPADNPQNANNSSFTDISDKIKQALAINYETLFPYTSSNIPCLEGKDGDGGNLQLFQLLAEPRTFSISHDYNAGTVSYSASYDTERSCSRDRGFEELTVTEEDPVPIIAEFIIPGREPGPIIQNLNTYTNKKVTFAFTGVTRKGCVDGNPWQEQWDDADGDVFSFIEDKMPYPATVKKIIETTEQSAMDKERKLIKTADSFNYNPVDGSYSINVTYLVCPLPGSGCEE